MLQLKEFAGWGSTGPASNFSRTSGQAPCLQMKDPERSPPGSGLADNEDGKARAASIATAAAEAASIAADEPTAMVKSAVA